MDDHVELQAVEGPLSLSPCPDQLLCTRSVLGGGGGIVHMPGIGSWYLVSI
jgi:hypothetical protein